MSFLASALRLALPVSALACLGVAGCAVDSSSAPPMPAAQKPVVHVRINDEPEQLVPIERQEKEGESCEFNSDGVHNWAIDKASGELLFCGGDLSGGAESSGQAIPARP